MSKDLPYADESLSIDPKEYLDYVRSLPCLISGKAADPHHLKAVGAGRRRSRKMLEDYMVVPLLRQYHTEFDDIGKTKFEEKYKINLYECALVILTRWIFNKSKLQEEEYGKRD